MRVCFFAGMAVDVEVAVDLRSLDLIRIVHQPVVVVVVVSIDLVTPCLIVCRRCYGRDIMPLSLNLAAASGIALSVIDECNRHGYGRCRLAEDAICALDGG